MNVKVRLLTSPNTAAKTFAGTYSYPQNIYSNSKFQGLQKFAAVRGQSVLCGYGRWQYSLCNS